MMATAKAADQLSVKSCKKNLPAALLHLKIAIAKSSNKTLLAITGHQRFKSKYVKMSK